MDYGTYIGRDGVTRHYEVIEYKEPPYWVAARIQIGTDAPTEKLFSSMSGAVRYIMRDICEQMNTSLMVSVHMKG